MKGNYTSAGREAEIDQALIRLFETVQNFVLV